MTPKDSPVHAVADLAGRSIGVAGGPIDKSWLLLRAAALGEGLDLAKDARPSYGAPPLIAEKLAQGETETALEFWNFCADLEGRGFRRAIEMADVEKALGASGPVAMTGYVFSESFAASHKDALKRFFAATVEARKILAQDPSAWAPIKARLNLKDDQALEVYRQRYLDGVPKRTVAEEAADASVLYRAARGDRRQGAGRRGQRTRRGSLLRSRDRRIRRDGASHLVACAACAVADRRAFRQSAVAAWPDGGIRDDEVGSRVGRAVRSARRPRSPAWRRRSFWRWRPDRRSAMRWGATRFLTAWPTHGSSCC